MYDPKPGSSSSSQISTPTHSQNGFAHDGNSAAPDSATRFHPNSAASPRRAFSWPSQLQRQISFGSTKTLTAEKGIGLGLGSIGSPMLPLHSPTLSRSSARRISYGLKSRAIHHAWPLTLGGLFTLAVFVFYYSKTPSDVSQFNSMDKLSLYGRSRFTDELSQYQVEAHRPDENRDNGVSLLTMDEDELIAEDDLFWDQYTDPTPLSAEEEAAQNEIQAHKADVIQRDKVQSLRALIWWLAEGGIVPSSFDVPSKSQLRKMGGRGVERMLEKIDHGEEGDEIFDDGWAEFANKRYRIVVFSKSYCPYSKKAKAILGEYHMSPAPFIIELDQRSDYAEIQDLLQRLTGRRTVPNVLLDFNSVGGSDDLELFHAEGGLQRKLEDMDVLPFARRHRPLVQHVPEVVARAEPEKEAAGVKRAGLADQAEVAAGKVVRAVKDEVVRDDSTTHLDRDSSYTEEEQEEEVY